MTEKNPLFLWNIQQIEINTLVWNTSEYD